MTVTLQADASPHPSRLAIAENKLPAMLALIAGMVDLTSFVSLGGVFTAHVTGNLVILAAVAVGGGHLNPAQALAVPVFMLATAGVWVIIRRTGEHSPSPVRSVLVAQFLLLVAVLALSVTGRAAQHPQGLAAYGAILLAASAMASQNALLHMQIAGAPSTAVMTGNLVSTVISTLDAFSHYPDRRAEARHRLADVLPPLIGFLLGCLAAGFVLLLDGNWAWALPAALAGLAVILPWKPKP